MSPMTIEGHQNHWDQAPPTGESMGASSLCSSSERSRELPRDGAAVTPVSGGCLASEASMVLVPAVAGRGPVAGGDGFSRCGRGS